MTQELEKLKKQKAEIEAQIEALEGKYPKEGEKIYYINTFGGVLEAFYCPSIDKKAFEKGYISKDKAFLERRLDRDMLRRELAEAADGWKPDYNVKDKYFIHYGTEERKFFWNYYVFNPIPGVIYFKEPVIGLIERLGERLNLLIDGEA